MVDVIHDSTYFYRINITHSHRLISWLEIGLENGNKYDFRNSEMKSSMLTNMAVLIISMRIDVCMSVVFE